MCLYPKLVINRKYVATKKNGGNIPVMKDPRTEYIPVGCGVCMECMKQKARNWRIRLMEEVRNRNIEIKFVTLSYSNEELTKLDKEIDITANGYERDNAIAKLSMRRFLERWRKKYKKSVKHWIVTELGQINTERLHLHGLIWTNEDTKIISEVWKYGNVWIGDYVNEITVNYIIKYIHKSDELHKYYKPIILTSAGIGNKYTERPDSKTNKYKKNKTNDKYTTRNGLKLPLPTYYRNKIYNDDEREELWLELLDKNVRYVNGIKIDISKNEDDYYRVLERQRALNKELGYGDDEENWEKKLYENNRRNLKRLQIRGEIESKRGENQYTGVKNDIQGRNNNVNNLEYSEIDNNIESLNKTNNKQKPKKPKQNEENCNNSSITSNNADNISSRANRKPPIAKCTMAGDSSNTTGSLRSTKPSNPNNQDMEHNWENFRNLSKDFE